MRYVERVIGDDQMPVGSPVRLTGGLLNEVWRVPTAGGSVVVKRFLPIEMEGIRLAPDRARFEAAGLGLFAGDGLLRELENGGVRVPRLLGYLPEAHVVVMEDLGPGWNLTDGHFGDNPGSLGAVIGRFIGGLHAQSFGDGRLRRTFANTGVQRVRHRLQYAALEERLEEWGYKDAHDLGRDFEALGTLLLRPGKCLVMGDLWPRSLLPQPDGVGIIDWEFAHFGRPLQDVAHLGAHCLMAAIRHGEDDSSRAAKVFWSAFYGAYEASLGAVRDRLWDDGERTAASLHLAAEILMRTIGPFRAGYLFDAATCDASIRHEAVQRAIAIAENPLQVNFGRLL